MRTVSQHQITKEDLSDILQSRLEISDKITSQLPISKYRDCLIKILVPGVASEIYSIIYDKYLKMSDIEDSFFQSFGENEILYTTLEIDGSSAELSYRLSFSKTSDFSDLLIEAPPQVSKQVISYLHNRVDYVR